MTLDFPVPERSFGEVVPPDRLRAALVREAAARWTSQRRGRRFPNDYHTVLLDYPANTILIQVLNDDYAFLSVGAALAAGFDENFADLRLSTLTARQPAFGFGLRVLYGMACNSGEPVFYRGWVGKDLPGARFAYHENAVLPFGAGEAVDHLLVVSVLVGRDGPVPPMPPDAQA